MCNKMYSKVEIIDGKEYRLVTLRGRSKLIAADGSAINPFRRKQKVTIHINADGYPCFGGGVPVHMYVGRAWVDGYFEGAEINHKDFDRMNYNADNLEWVSHADNIRYSIDYNSKVWFRSKQGENNGRAKFTEEKVREIRKLYADGMTIAQILQLDHPEMNTAKAYHNLHSTYYNILKGYTWKNVF